MDLDDDEDRVEKRYLPYDDYVKEWLVTATTLRNEDEYFELHKDEIILRRNNNMLHKKKAKYKSYDQQRIEKRKKRMSKLREMYGLHTPSSNYFGKAVASPPKENLRPYENNFVDNNKYNSNESENGSTRPLSPIFFETHRVAWEPKRSRTPTRFGFDEDDYQHRNEGKKMEVMIKNPPMIFNNHEYNDGYTNKLGVKQKEGLRKGVTQPYLEPNDEKKKKLECNKNEEEVLQPQSPPPQVIARVPSPFPTSEKTKTTTPTIINNSNTNIVSLNKITPPPPTASNLDTSGENLDMEVDELLNWVDGLDEQFL